MQGHDLSTSTRFIWLTWSISLPRVQRHLLLTSAKGVSECCLSFISEEDLWHPKEGIESPESTVHVNPKHMDRFQPNQPNQFVIFSFGDQPILSIQTYQADTTNAINSLCNILWCHFSVELFVFSFVFAVVCIVI